MSEQTKQNSESVKPTQQEYFDKFLYIYTELSTLNEDIKQLSDSFKEDYPEADLSNLKKVSKLKAEQRLGDNVDKVNAFLEAVDTFTN